MPKTYGIFFNGNSGDGKGEDIARQLRDSLIKNHHEPFLITGKNSDDAVKSVKEALSQIDVLVVIGGDGTINLAMTALIQTNSTLPVGIVPAGTVNNFAKRFHLPLDTEAAINLVVGLDQTRTVGIATCNGEKAIISSLTFGNLTDISNDVRQEEKRKFGKIIYLGKALKHIGKDKSLKVKMTLGGKPSQMLKIWFALITTTKSVGGHVYAESAPDKMHISILNNINLRKVVSYVYFAFTGRLGDSKSVEYLTNKSARFEPLNHEDIKTRIDGDESLSLPVDIKYRPDFITLITPRNSLN